MGFIESAKSKTNEAMKTTAGEVSLGQSFGLGISKALAERATMPILGNGSYKSGFLKTGTALLTAMIPAPEKYHLKTVKNYAASGLMLDAVDDFMHALSKSMTGGDIAAEGSGLI